MAVNVDIYRKKKLKELSSEEWEALCDGCGKCCFRKFIEGRGKRTKLYFTRICCNLFDVKTGKCCDKMVCNTIGVVLFPNLYAKKTEKQK